MTTQQSPVATQLRLVLTVDDLDLAVSFFRDALGLPVELDLTTGGTARVVILDAGRATLELANSDQAALIDQVEVGHRVAPPLRLALQVIDTTHTTDRLVAASAALVAAPVTTPWDSINSRLDTSFGVQITLFQERTPEGAP
jgi:catechol 2,3-dioxygenase-like lactoylglutathione lyase family enzyme